MSVPLRRTVVPAIAVTLAAVAFGFRLITVRDLSNDHYMHLAWAQQILFGDVPGRDFVDPGMPLMYVLSAIVQWLFPGPFSEAVLSSALLAAAAAVIFVVTTDLTGSILAGLIAALFQIAFEARLYSYPKILVPAVVLLLMQQHVRHPSRRGLILLGVWTAVAVLLRHDLGVYASAGIGAGLVAAHWRAWVRMSSALVEYAIAVIAALVALTFLRNPRGILAWSNLDSAAFLFYSSYLLAIVTLVLFVMRLRERTEKRSDVPTLSAALTMLVLYVMVVLRHPIQSRVQDLGALFAILGAWAAVEIGRRTTASFSRGRMGARLASAATLVVTLMIGAAATASMWDLGDVTDRIKETRVTDGLDLMERTLQGVKETGTQWPWERFWPAGEMPEAVRYLNACLSPDEAVMVTWKAPEYYYFSRRRFGGGHAVFESPAAFSTPHDQELMIARLRKVRVPIVLINETLRTDFAGTRAGVDAYLKREYVPAGRFQIRDGSDITIAVRRDLTPGRIYGADRWPCGFESRAARTIASIMLEGSATPFPAMSNAVP